MATLTITAANVVPGSGSYLGRGTAGETITRGMAVYRKSSDGLLYKATAATGDPATSKVVGIAAEDVTVNQPLQYYRGGQYTVGATITKGGVYCLAADSAGGIAPYADLVATDYTTVLFVGITTTVALLCPGFPASLVGHG